MQICSTGDGILQLLDLIGDCLSDIVEVCLELGHASIEGIGLGHECTYSLQDFDEARVLPFFNSLRWMGHGMAAT